jgi:hypothetical protein
MPQGELTLNQKYQMVTGTLMSQGKPIEVAGKLNGEEITFTAGPQEFKGKLRGNTLEGTVTAKGGASSSWSATRSADDRMGATERRVFRPAVLIWLTMARCG